MSQSCAMNSMSSISQPDYLGACIRIGPIRMISVLVSAISPRFFPSPTRRLPSDTWLLIHAYICMSRVIRADWHVLYTQDLLICVEKSRLVASLTRLSYMRAQFTLHGVTSQRPSPAGRVSMHAQRWRVQMYVICTAPETSPPLLYSAKGADIHSSALKLYACYISTAQPYLAVFAVSDSQFGMRKEETSTLR